MTDLRSFLKIIDLAYQPGAGDPPDNPVMKMDMVCFIIAGEFTIQKTGIPAYTVKEGDFCTCGIGKMTTPRTSAR
jgi:hypothetical protein